MNKIKYESVFENFPLWLRILLDVLAMGILLLTASTALLGMVIAGVAVLTGNLVCS